MNRRLVAATLALVLVVLALGSGYYLYGRFLIDGSHRDNEAEICDAAGCRMVQAPIGPERNPPFGVMLQIINRTTGVAVADIRYVNMYFEHGGSPYGMGMIPSSKNPMGLSLQADSWYIPGPILYPNDTVTFDIVTNARPYQYLIHIGQISERQLDPSSIHGNASIGLTLVTMSGPPRTLQVCVDPAGIRCDAYEQVTIRDIYAFHTYWFVLLSL